eukprot:PhM_4_TR1686/c0_g1_i2/m.74881/K13993/HSP20; HSP20 family protein
MFGGGNNNNNNNNRGGPWDPFRDFDDQVRRVFGEHGGVGGFFGGPGTFLSSSSSASGWWSPIDLVETKERYILSAELPGIQRDAVEINVSDNRVCLKAHRGDVMPSDVVANKNNNHSNDDDSATFLCRERFPGEFSYLFFCFFCLVFLYVM